jgi:hypothetical protein
MSDDPRDRPTRPPAAPRREPPPLPQQEDSPPGLYREVPSRQLTEPIARIALRAPPSPAATPESELLKALAQTESKLLAQMRQELKSLVVTEVKSIPPPPLPSPEPKKFEWAHLQYLGGLIVAVTGLIAALQSCNKPSAEIVKRLDAMDGKIDAVTKALAAHIDDDKEKRAQTYQFELDERSWITDVLERAASVKIDDPPGTPPRSQLQFYPPPLVDPHRVTHAPIVQPHDPYPVPPPP